MEFTFEKAICTDIDKLFGLDWTDIKFNKKQVGCISELRDGKYLIRFAIKKEKTKEDSASFMWITLKRKFNSEQEARDEAKRIERDIQQLNLYQIVN